MFLNLFFSDRTQQSAAGGPSPSGAHHAFPPHKQQSDRELLLVAIAVEAVQPPTRAPPRSPRCTTRRDSYIPLQVRAPLATLSPSTPPNASTPTKGAAVGGSTITHGAHPHQPLYQPHNHHIYQAPASQTGAPPGAVPAFRRGSSSTARPTATVRMAVRHLPDGPLARTPASGPPAAWRSSAAGRAAQSLSMGALSHLQP